MRPSILLLSFLAALLLLAGFTLGGWGHSLLDSPALQMHHDAARGVTCYSTTSANLSCWPDVLLQSGQGGQK